MGREAANCCCVSVPSDQLNILTIHDVEGKVVIQNHHSNPRCADRQPNCDGIGSMPVREASNDNNECNEIQHGEGEQEWPKKKRDVEGVTRSARLPELGCRHPMARSQHEVHSHPQQIENDPLG